MTNMVRSVHLDESGFIKSGKNSVGVKQQYCGRFGKVENCQVGVFLGYALWNRRTLIDRRLYLPEDWAKFEIMGWKCLKLNGFIYNMTKSSYFNITMKCGDERLFIFM